MSAPVPIVLREWSEIEQAFGEFPQRTTGVDEEGDLVRTGWVFRGHQSEDYELVPSIERQSNGKTSWLASEFAALSEFQAKARMYMDVSGLGSESDPAARLNWLSVMQHYGVPTRLLDFTRSPYIALHFALRHSPERCKAADVWAIDAEALTRIAKEFSREADREEKKHWDDWHSSGRPTVPGPGPTAKWRPPSGPAPRAPVFLSLDPMLFADTREQLEDENRESAQMLTYALTPDKVRRECFSKSGFVALAEPGVHNRRLSSQQGLFLFNGAVDLSFRDSLFKMMEKCKTDWCKLFRVPVSARADFERKLSRMNVHDLSLFPDVEGLAGFIRQEARLHWFPITEDRTKCFAIVVERSACGYTAYSPDVPAVTADGPTGGEARSGIQQALVTHCEALRAAGKPVPKPTSAVGYVEVPE